MGRDPVEAVLDYHERTRHGLDRSAPAPGRMDWSTEPDPFRRFAGAPIERLDLCDETDTPPYDALFETGAITPAPLDRSALSRFFYFGLALSAWKEYRGARWSLRVNPSSGDLHPTECYVLTDALGAPALYHYAPKEHGLELRAEFEPDSWARFAARLPRGAFPALLTSIAWRESWKYGERAYRYCQQDLGHALAALRFSAALLGWQLGVVAGVGDDAVARLAGLDRDDASHAGEEESPAMLLAVAPPGSTFDHRSFPPGEPRPRRWYGAANRLSPRHRDWPAIAAVERACRRPEGGRRAEPIPRRADPYPIAPYPLSGGEVIRRRRSALDLDGRTAMPRRRFYGSLLRIMPRATVCPFDALPWRPLVQLGLFVHRVEDLPSGLYALVRCGPRFEEMRRAMRGDFAWRTPEGCPRSLPLYLLAEGDVRGIAVTASCEQSMAGDGAFCAALLAHFEPVLRRDGAAFYRNLHWEAGVIAHVLYLEAEAARLRGTGMGCFLDRSSHGAFGIRDLSLQTLYHFTAGGPVEDTRLITLPAYPEPAA